MQTLLQTKEFAFVRAAQKLEALSPLKVMMRGGTGLYMMKRSKC